MSLSPTTKPHKAPAAARALALLGALATLAALALPAPAQADYAPCLGCAEHTEMQVRWHRPFLLELAGEGALLYDHFRLEARAADLGLCESDVLIRDPASMNGCHRYSATRAYLIEAPLEIVAFTSPAWGLERRGHPRWALALEAVPLAYHALSARATTEAIHRYQLEQLLYN